MEEDDQFRGSIGRCLLVEVVELQVFLDLQKVTLDIGGFLFVSVERPEIVLS